MELRSRALLIANLAKGAQFKNAATVEDEQQIKSEQEAAANVSEFVKVVDLAQGIAEVLLQLKQLGHFLYQKQVSKVDLSPVVCYSISGDVFVINFNTGRSPNSD